MKTQGSKNAINNAMLNCSLVLQMIYDFQVVEYPLENRLDFVACCRVGFVVNGVSSNS